MAGFCYIYIEGVYLFLCEIMEQIPLTNVLDELYDPDWSPERKREVRRAYRQFFEKLTKADRKELNAYINDDYYGREERN